MTALIQGRQRDYETLGSLEFILTGVHVYYGSAACGIMGGTKAGFVTSPPLATVLAASLLSLGIFTEEVDATAADATVTVRLQKEVEVEWWANDGTVTAADVFGTAFHVDDQTVGRNAAGALGVAPRSRAGRIWKVDATLGVAVEVVRDLDASNKPIGLLPAPAAGDIVVVAVPRDSLLEVPTLAANSTITLPANHPDTEATIWADGTKNGFTVQVRDVTGPVNLTAAFTASKRLNIRVSCSGGKWSAAGAAAP